MAKVALNKASFALLAAMAAVPADASYFSNEKDAKQLMTYKTADGTETPLAEFNRNIVNDKGDIAFRLTEAGRALHASKAAEPEKASTPRAPAVTAEEAASFQVFGPEDTPATPEKRRGNAGVSYPFDKLVVGGSFFIPATEARPEPWNSLRSTINTASKRYDDKPEGEKRKFTLIQGQLAGKPGAYVKRTA